MKGFNSLEELEEYLNKKEKEFKSFKESIGTYKDLEDIMLLKSLNEILDFENEIDEEGREE